MGRYAIEFKDADAWMPVYAENGDNLELDSEQEAIEYCAEHRTQFNDYRYVDLYDTESDGAEPIDIIKTVYEGGAASKKQILDALEDGAALASLGITDEDAVLQAWQMVSDSDLDEHLAAGGTIGNYQW